MMIIISEVALYHSVLFEAVCTGLLSWAMFRWGRRYERRRLQEAFGRAIRERNARGDDELRFTMD
jgi:hypothetical protein